MYSPSDSNTNIKTSVQTSTIIHDLTSLKTLIFTSHRPKNITFQILKMEATRSLETQINIYLTIRCQIPKYFNLYSHHKRIWSLNPEGGSWTILWNIGKHEAEYTAPHMDISMRPSDLRRQAFCCSPYGIIKFFLQPYNVESFVQCSQFLPVWLLADRNWFQYWISNECLPLLLLAWLIILRNQDRK